MSKQTVRIGGGQGFWGDWLDAPGQLIHSGEIDYLVLDYLAEVTMSILAKQRKRDPSAGYARDFVTLFEREGSEIKKRGIRVVSNAGGLNPTEAANSIKRILPQTKIGTVTGDDVSSRLQAITQANPLENIDSKVPFGTRIDHLESANAYIGGEGITELLGRGADVVVTGRVADPSLVLGILVHEFSWKWDDWDKLAAGVVAGHLIECGAQVTGGNLLDGWENVPEPENIGFPIVTVSKDGSIIVSKPQNTGGVVNSSTVKEQLLYEIGDPTCYITPDCVVDFTSITVEEISENQVRVFGVKGKERPSTLKATLCYRDGYKASGTLVYTWPKALENAKRADTIIRKRIEKLGLQFDALRTEFIGANSCHEHLSEIPEYEPPEVMLRIAAKGQDRAALTRFTREIAPLVLSGPPGVTGYASGKQRVEEVVAFWPALLKRDDVEIKATLI